MVLLLSGTGCADTGRPRWKVTDERLESRWKGRYVHDIPWQGWKTPFCGQGGEVGPHTLWVGLLGPFEVRIDAALVGPGGARRRGLLALLAAEPNVVHPVASIIDSLWGEEPPASAVNVVQTYVSAWRKVLGGSGGPLARVGAGYRLALTSEQCDLLAFRALVGESRAQQARAAADSWRAPVGLWRGPAL